MKPTKEELKEIADCWEILSTVTYKQYPNTTKSLTHKLRRFGLLK